VRCAARSARFSRPDNPPRVPWRFCVKIGSVQNPSKNNPANFAKKLYFSEQWTYNLKKGKL
jgi:hypothetical protein